MLCIFLETQLLLVKFKKHMTGDLLSLCVNFTSYFHNLVILSNLFLNICVYSNRYRLFSTLVGETSVCQYKQSTAK